MMLNFNNWIDMLPLKCMENLNSFHLMIPNMLFFALSGNIMSNDVVPVAPANVLMEANEANLYFMQWPTATLLASINQFNDSFLLSQLSSIIAYLEEMPEMHMLTQKETFPFQLLSLLMMHMLNGMNLAMVPKLIDVKSYLS